MTDEKNMIPEEEQPGIGENGAEESGSGDGAAKGKAPKASKGKQQQREKKKRSGSQKKDKGDEKPAKEPSFFSEVATEMRRVTWPGKAEVLKWGAVVLAALLFFTVFTALADNFVVTPVMYALSGIDLADGEFGILPILLTIILFLSGALLLLAIMMHSGDGGGLSDTAATTIAGGANSTAVVERNLDRLTVILAIVFTLTLIAMMFVFPQGTIGQ